MEDHKTKFLESVDYRAKLSSTIDILQSLISSGRGIRSSISSMSLAAASLFQFFRLTSSHLQSFGHWPPIIEIGTAFTDGWVTTVAMNAVGCNLRSFGYAQPLRRRLI